MVAFSFKKREIAVTLQILTILTGHRYVITDYERGKFSVAQSKFSAGLQNDIVAINSSNVTTDSRRQGIGPKSIIGATIGSSVAVLLLLIVLRFAIRKWLRASESRLGTIPSSPKSLQVSTHADMNVVDEIGHNSLYNAYPELHDIGRVEMLTLPIPPGHRNSIRELPQSSKSVMSHSDGKSKISENEVDHIQATAVRRQKTRSSNLDDQSSSSKWRSQHKVTKARRQPESSRSKSFPPGTRPKKSSPIYQDSIYSNQPITDGSELSPIESNAQYHLRLSLHSPLKLSRTASESSTYGNIIDYYY